VAPSCPVVLVADDEAAVADTYALRLDDTYETRVAYDGEETLAAVDDDVDAVLLDRRMPGLSGDDVLERLRGRGYDGVVVMVTAVDPDLNILEMDFDDYLCKPVDRETILRTLEQHLGPPDSTDDRLREFFRVISKLSVLRAEETRAALEADEEFRRLEKRADELATDLRERVDGFEDLVETHRSIGRGSP
jgi:DNA-binding response OmpR family regulator